MARISGVDLPNDKRVEIGLTYIYGIGKTTSDKIIKATGVNPDTRCRDLTEEDVKKLQRSGNPNASDNSAHCYGTTFDITYTRYWREDENEVFMQPYELTKVLAEVLRDRKEAGKCLVKYERKEHCFHITSTH